jgi:hypothetical protein
MLRGPPTPAGSRGRSSYTAGRPCPSPPCTRGKQSPPWAPPRLLVGPPGSCPSRSAGVASSQLPAPRSARACSTRSSSAGTSSSVVAAISAGGLAAGRARLLQTPPDSSRLLQKALGDRRRTSPLLTSNTTGPRRGASCGHDASHLWTRAAGRRYITAPATAAWPTWTRNPPQCRPARAPRDELQVPGDRGRHALPQRRARRSPPRL